MSAIAGEDEQGAQPGHGGDGVRRPQFSFKAVSETETYRRAWRTGASEDIPGGKGCYRPPGMETS